jgi:hypothetical protein
MKLLQALRNAAARLAADLEDSNLFEHAGDKGEFREHIIGRFLRPFLPECYGLGSGQVFAADGASSAQVDIAVYDAIFSNVLFRDAGNSLFPCESIYGTIEVKSRLSVAELETSIANGASVKRLARAPADGGDLLPYRRLAFAAPLALDPQQRNPYLSMIFAYEGLAAPTVVEVLNRHLASGPAPAALLPDYLFSYRRGFAVLRAQGNQVAPFGGPFDRYVAVESGADTLPLFFLTLNICLNSIFLRAPDFNAYWLQVFGEILRGAPGERSA